MHEWLISIDFLYRLFQLCGKQKWSHSVIMGNLSTCTISFTSFSKKNWSCHWTTSTGPLPTISNKTSRKIIDWILYINVLFITIAFQVIFSLFEKSIKILFFHISDQIMKKRKTLIERKSLFDLNSSTYMSGFITTLRCYSIASRFRYCIKCLPFVGSKNKKKI